MIEQIKKSKKCGLCKKQSPLLDIQRECQETNTGMLIKKIEELCQDVTTYKTNLVKCLPHKEYGS